jgi:hypothetical protein
MSNEMNKQFQYRGYKFNIKVELNYSVERHPNGKKLHKITLNDMGVNNYSKSFEVEEPYITGTISALEITAQKYTDGKLDGIPSVNQELTDMGFE